MTSRLCLKKFRNLTQFVLGNRAAAYIAVQKYKHAIKDAEKAIEINPNFANAYK